jgi:rod shape-determining protein MreD
MRRILLPVVLLLAALVLQLTVLDRLPLPGGVAPDLVLLMVVALALSGGPMSGMIWGFCAGLALDVAPPSGHLIGVYALVFCLLGYFCGLVSAELESSVLLPLAASALGAAAGAGLYAAVGIILGNPDVTGPAVRHVLPLSVLYDVLLSPFVLFGVALASRLAARLAGAAKPAAEPAAGTAAGRGPPALPEGQTPRIRAAAARPRDGWIGGGGWLAASAELARRRQTTVRLHFSGTRTAATPARAKTANGGGGVARLRFGGTRTAATPTGPKTANGGGGGARLRFGGTRTAATPARPRTAAGAGNGVARLRFGGGRRGDAVIGSRFLRGGLATSATAAAGRWAGLPSRGCSPGATGPPAPVGPGSDAAPPGATAAPAPPAAPPGAARSTPPRCARERPARPRPAAAPSTEAPRSAVR